MLAISTFHPIAFLHDGFQHPTNIEHGAVIDFYVSMG